MQIRTVKYQNETALVNFSDEMAMACDAVASTGRGHFAYVSRHLSGVNDPKCQRPTDSDKWYIANPRYDRYLARRAAALLTITTPALVASMVSTATWERLTKKLSEENAKATLKGEKETTIETLFSNAKQDLQASIVKTQAGDRNDGYRQGHDACYATFDGGDVSVKVHLVTAEDATGHKRPVLAENGLMTCASIMLPYFLIERRTHDNGVWLATNSKALTLMKKAIEEATKIPEWNQLSIGVGNFQYITLDSNRIKGETVDMQAKLKKENEYRAFLRDLCGTAMDILDLLAKEAGHPVTVNG